MKHVKQSMIVFVCLSAPCVHAQTGAVGGFAQGLANGLRQGAEISARQQEAELLAQQVRRARLEHRAATGLPELRKLEEADRTADKRAAEILDAIAKR
jgi:hypothetical protein